MISVAAVLTSCGRDGQAPSGEASPQVTQGVESQAWCDSVKARGLRGDADGAREALRRYRETADGGKELYVAWGNVVSFLFNQGEILAAVDEVQEMERHAGSRNDAFGLAMVEMAYGGLSTYSFKNSIEHLRKAMAYWEGTDNVAQMQYTLYMLSRELLGESENTESAQLDPRVYAEVLANSDRIEELDSTNRYMVQVSEYQRLMTYLATRDEEQAKGSYEKVARWRESGEISPQLQGMMANAMAQYQIAFGDARAATGLIEEVNLPLYRLQTERKQAIALGDYRKATELQEQIDRITIQRINQLQQSQLAIADAAFHNLQLERDNHQLEIEKMEKVRLLVWLSLLAAALLSFLIVSLVYQRRMMRKNLELVQRIKAQEDESAAAEAGTSAAQAGTAEAELFKRIAELLSDEAVLTDQGLNRDKIASLLGTNRTYVAQAISECTGGKSVSAYINAMRVRLGRRLLEDPKMSINEIVYASGFSSRSHFHNLFTAEYGITPAQFRKTLKRL